MELEPLQIEDARTVASRVLDLELLEQAWGEGRTMTLDRESRIHKEGIDEPASARIGGVFPGSAWCTPHESLRMDSLMAVGAEETSHPS